MVLLIFLELKIIKNGSGFQFDWYIKPMSSGNYLNFLSQHPVHQKIGVVTQLVDKVFFLSDEQFHEKNFAKVEETLMKNNYPIEFIRKQLNKRLYKLKSQNPVNPQVKETTDMRFIVFPHVKNLNHKLKRFFNNSEFKSIWKPTNKLNEQIIKRGKDKIPISQEQGVVFKVNCKNCDSCYIGQTKHSVETRMK
jgi:hypothetical protein